MTEMGDNRTPMKRCIKQMDTNTAKSICSGQVMTSLSNVVKELVENSIDAKATHISINCKDYGKQCLEVIDNGYGIEESDFECLAKRYFTSKLNQFNELQTISTFGFRGEALNSLCNLSNVSIHTRNIEQSVGTKLRFNSEAIIVNRESIARNIGTTVSVENLFHTIPVRRKEFVNNINREFDKMVRLIYSYCIGCVGVRITCSNQLDNKSKQIFSSPGLSIRNNIIEIFDAKQSNALIEFKQCSETVERLNIYLHSIKMSGLISKCDSGCGRTANDRQFFYINRRPCELRTISKYINEIYHSFNRNQYPFVLLNIDINKNLVDINVTPDKRLIMVSNEEHILEIIKDSLLKMYNKESGCQLDSLSNYTTKKVYNVSQKRTKETVDEEVEHIMSSPLKMSRCRSPCDSPFRDAVTRVSTPVTPPLKTTYEKPNQSFITARNAVESEDSPQTIVDNELNRKTSFNSIQTIEEQNIESNTYPSLQNTSSNQSVNEKSKCLTEFQIIVDSDEESENRTLSKTNIDIDFEMVCNNFQKAMIDSNPTNESHFTAQIRPSQNDLAEQELNHQLKKTSFKSMKIIGQFNRGFIITKLNSDLFIIDQHASDERFNYETQLSNTPIENQALVCPLPLELSAANELLVIDNLMTMKKLGFGIVVNDSANSGHKLHLSSLPISKEWTASKQDIDEIIGAIIQTPINLLTDYKLSGFKRVIASRACRSSFMIGESLSLPQMKTIVSQMSELKNPWHCAHHRPTVRHLVNLNKISSLISN